MAKKGNGNNIVDIRERRLVEASELLVPVLSDLYDEYGLEISLTILIYYLSRGIYYNGETTSDFQREQLTESVANMLKVQNEENRIAVSKLNLKNKVDTEGEDD